MFVNHPNIKAVCSSNKDKTALGFLRVKIEIERK